MVSIKRNLY